MKTDTPLTDKIESFREEMGPVDKDVSWHDLLNHARQMERERNQWAGRWADLNRTSASEAVKHEGAKNVLRIVLNGGIDDGLTWDQVMDMVRDIVKPNDKLTGLPGEATCWKGDK